MRKLSRILIVGLVFGFLATPGFAVAASENELQRGLEAYEAGDHAAALAIWRPLAEAGSTEAQYYVGVLYDTGEGVPQDSEIAFNWYRKAASLGHARAQYNLGLAYLQGQGTEKNPAEGAKWIGKSALQEWPPAEYTYGLLLAQGIGIEKNEQEAVSWLQQAAGHDHPDAQYALGMMYLAGQGVDKDPTAGVGWLRKAAEQSHLDAIYALGTYNPARGLEGELAPGPADELQGGQWSGSHGVQVRDGISRGDPAPVEGVIDDRGEEVDGLHQQVAGRRAEDPGIVGDAEPHDEVGVGHRR